MTPDEWENYCELVPMKLRKGQDMIFQIGDKVVRKPGAPAMTRCDPKVLTIHKMTGGPGCDLQFKELPGRWFYSGYFAPQDQEADAMGGKPDHRPLEPLISAEEAITAKRLYECLAHGDDTHKAWLFEAIQSFFAGLPIPPVRSATPVKPDHNFGGYDYGRDDLNMAPGKLRPGLAENPKDAIGSTKPPTHNVPMVVIAEVGAAMLEGGLKYGEYNYRVAKIRASVYVDAIKRHLTQFWDLGENIDSLSGLHHITKLIASAVVLRDAIITGKWVDDRPPPVPAAAWEELEKATKAILAKYPNPERPYTAKDYPNA